MRMPSYLRETIAGIPSLLRPTFLRSGETYTWSNEIMSDLVTFLVVAETTHWSSKVDRDGGPGYLALLLDGEHRSSSWAQVRRPGETFTFAQSSAIAANSKPL